MARKAAEKVADIEVQTMQPEAGSVEQFGAAVAGGDAPAVDAPADVPAGKDPVRSARAKKMWEKRRAQGTAGTRSRRARTTRATADAPAEPPQKSQEQLLQEQVARANDFAPLIHMLGSELIDDKFPERPYSERDALQLSMAAVPVLDKYATGVQRYAPEVTLIAVVLIQVNAYRKIARMRRQAHSLPATDNGAQPTPTDRGQDGLWQNDPSEVSSESYRPRYRTGP